MSGNGYLFAAYAVTWIIHITYLGTIVRRYKRLQGEIAALKKPGPRPLGVSCQRPHRRSFFLRPET